MLVDGSALSPPPGELLGLLCQVEGGDAVLAYGLLVFHVELGVLVLDDLAHVELRQFLRHQLLVEQATLDGRLVLDKGGDNLVQVFLTDTRGVLALRFGEPLDFDLELTRLLVKPTLHFSGS